MDNNNDSQPTHAITLHDGRTLALDEFGDPEGAPVLLLTSAPGSRRLDPDPAATRAAGIRLLVVDRPGYGASTPLPEGAMPNCTALADDLAAALRQLDITHTSVVGWSGGGLGALALAATHPALVTAGAIVGTPAPDDELPWIPDHFRDLLHSLRADPASAIATLTPMLAGVAQDPAAALPSIATGPADERLLKRPDVRPALEAMLAEAFRQGARGMATDILTTLDVELESVVASVALYYGESDVIIPPAHGDYYASKIRNAHLERVADTGHLVLIDQWAEILEALRRSVRS